MSTISNCQIVKLSDCQSNCQIVTISNVMYYQSVWIRLAHRLYTDFQYFWIQAKTTRWTRGSIESVAYVSNNGHGGGYTYRYRKIGSFSFHPSILLPANTIELFFFMPSLYNFHHNIRMSQGTLL